MVSNHDAWHAACSVRGTERQDSMLEIVKRHLKAFESANWTEYKADMANDVVYEEIPTRLRVRGPDEFIKAVQRWKRAFPDSRANLLSSIVTADNVTAEVEWEGTQTGPLDGPFGMIQPTNKRGNVKAVLLYKFKNNRIVEARHYFDLLTILSQIGVAPVVTQPGQAAAGAAAPMTRHP